MIKYFKLALGLLLLSPSIVAQAQTRPLVVIGGQTRQLPTATTMGLNAATTGAASINIPQGTTPATPNNGDVWTTANGVFAKVNGAVIGPLASGTRDIAAAADVAPMGKLVRNITGTTSLGQPTTGYNFVLDASNIHSKLVNSTGWNQQTGGNDGRTGVANFTSLMENRGNGDTMGFYANCNLFSPAGKSGATHWLAQPACAALGANMATLVPHSYLQGGEFNYDDNGVDAAAIAWVHNFNRTVNTGSFGEVWMGDRIQSRGTKGINVGWSGSGIVNVGLDLVTATADASWNSGKTIVVNMSADQRITYNSTATPLNGISYYGNLPGNAYDTYNSGTSYLSRCNNSGCFSINAQNFLASGVNASGIVQMAVTNTDTGASGIAQIKASHGSGSIIDIRAASGYTLVNSSTQALGLGVAGTTYLSVAADGNIYAANGAGIQLAKKASSGLPTCNSASEGRLYAVTDANSTTFNAALVGGGTNHVMGYCNGTEWTVH